jgi:hypothetical protein
MAKLTYRKLMRRPSKAVQAAVREALAVTGLDEILAAATGISSRLSDARIEQPKSDPDEGDK